MTGGQIIVLVKRDLTVVRGIEEGGAVKGLVLAQITTMQDMVIINPIVV